MTLWCSLQPESTAALLLDWPGHCRTFSSYFWRAQETQEFHETAKNTLCSVGGDEWLTLGRGTGAVFYLKEENPATMPCLPCSCPGSNPIHIYLEASPTEQSGALLLSSTHRIGGDDFNDLIGTMRSSRVPETSVEFHSGKQIFGNRNGGMFNAYLLSELQVVKESGKFHSQKHLPGLNPHLVKHSAGEGGCWQKYRYCGLFLWTTSALCSSYSTGKCSSHQGLQGSGQSLR